MLLMEERNLPVPRMELRWDERPAADGMLACSQNIVLKLRENDIRREQADVAVDGFIQRDYITVNIDVSAQECSDGESPVNAAQDGTGSIWRPFRLTAHALWDAEQLQLPVYVVARGKAQLVTAQRN